MLGCDYSLLWVSSCRLLYLLWPCLLRLLLTRWASLLPPEHEQPSELQLLLQELAPPPAACAEHLHDAKAEGEAEEAEEEAEEAEEAEAAEAAEAAEEEAMVRRLLALRQYIEMRSEMRRERAPKV